MSKNPFRSIGGIAVAATVLALIPVAVAQVPPQDIVTELTEEERESLAEVQAMLPPKGATFEEWVAWWRTPRPFPKERVVRLGDERAYPNPVIPTMMEIVREDDENVWLRALPPEDPESHLHADWQIAEAEQRRFLERQAAIDAATMLDFPGQPVLPPTVDTLRFEPIEAGFPEGGRWQMGAAFGDLNDDGRADLVLPPPRKGPGRPFVYLATDDGFEVWRGVRWDDTVPYDYGAVAVGDFDRDGHGDIALAIHFKGQYVLYGDGEGGFVAEELPRSDPRLSSRGVAVADFDLDGRPDLAFQAEIDYIRDTNSRIEEPTIWVVLNRETGWSLDERPGLPSHVIGDVIRTADVDGDGRPDLIASANTSGWTDLVIVNRPNRWTPIGGDGVFDSGYHFDVAASPHACGDERDRAIYAAFMQFREVDGANLAASGIARYPFGRDPADVTLNREPQLLLRAEGRGDHYFRVAAGDLDGDGRTDLVAGRRYGTLEILLQRPDGSFVIERSPELESIGRPFDLILRDLDGDGRDDLVGMFAADEEADLPGGVAAWISRSGTAGAAGG